MSTQLGLRRFQLNPDMSGHHLQQLLFIERSGLTKQSDSYFNLYFIESARYQINVVIYFWYILLILLKLIS